MWNCKFVLPPVRVRMVQLTTEQRVFFKRNRLFVWNCFAFRCVMLFDRSGSYNYSAIHSIKIPELSQRTFKTKGLISTSRTTVLKSMQWPVPLITYSEYNYQHAFRTCYGIINKIPAKPYHGSCIQNNKGNLLFPHIYTRHLRSCIQCKVLLFS